MHPTIQAMTELQSFFDTANAQLFGSTLPQCLITIDQSKKSKGFFWPRQFVNAEGVETHQINIHPEFMGRDIKDTLSTLAHEMVHLWQEEFGKPPKRSYHNKEWANKMDEIGLPPACPKNSGKRTGAKMTHTVQPSGLFDALADEWLAAGNTITFYKLPERLNIDAGGADGEGEGEGEAAKKKASRSSKYVCGGCGVTVRGKPELALACIACEQQLEMAI